MPLTSKGKKIKSAMTEQYGEKKGEQVFYASKNKGNITGVDRPKAVRAKVAKKYPDMGDSGNGGLMNKTNKKK
jgi:hypothetical protein